MLTLVETGATTLFVGAAMNHASTVVHEIIGRALCDGATVCLLAETRGDVSLFISHLTLWLRARERNPSHAERIVGLPNYRQWPEAEALASQIIEACQPEPEAGGAGRCKHIVVFLDLASEMLAAHPGDHRLAVCADLPLWLPNATVIVSAHHGSENMPPPPLATYRADRVYRVQCSGVAINVRLTPIKPPGDPISLNGAVHAEGIVCIDEQESSDVAD